MAPPNGLEPVASAGWNHKQPETNGQPRPDFEAALREAYALSAKAELRLSHSKLVRLVRAFVRTREAGQEFGDWVTTYADPTGETAVWRVLSGRAA